MIRICGSLRFLATERGSSMLGVRSSVPEEDDGRMDRRAEGGAEDPIGDCSMDGGLTDLRNYQRELGAVRQDDSTGIDPLTDGVSCFTSDLRGLPLLRFGSSGRGVATTISASSTSTSTSGGGAVFLGLPLGLFGGGGAISSVASAALPFPPDLDLFSPITDS
jgi:hypothetical protein